MFLLSWAEFRETLYARFQPKWMVCLSPKDNLVMFALKGEMSGEGWNSPYVFKFHKSWGVGDVQAQKFNMTNLCKTLWDG